MHPCQQRLAFEELLAHYLSLRSLRALAETEDATGAGSGGEHVIGFVGACRFLTGAQQRVADEFLGDLSQPHPMMRLIQGDVGSGKTVVAAIACLQAIACGVQAAIMAPTDILAEQHWRNFSAGSSRLALTRVAFRQSARGGAARVSGSIADGRASIAVGTHALFQEGVRFQNLALVIIDEQA